MLDIICHGKQNVSWQMKRKFLYFQRKNYTEVQCGYSLPSTKKRKKKKKWLCKLHLKQETIKNKTNQTIFYFFFIFFNADTFVMKWQYINVIMFLHSHITQSRYTIVSALNTAICRCHHKIILLFTNFTL